MFLENLFKKQTKLLIYRNYLFEIREGLDLFVSTVMDIVDVWRQTVITWSLDIQRGEINRWTIIKLNTDQQVDDRQTI